MYAKLRSHLTYANVMATIAVFVALGGSGYAAVKINGKNIENKSIAGKKLKNRTVTRKKVKKDTLTGTEIKESTLGKLPRATRADSAAAADNASNLGGKPASAYASFLVADEAPHVVGGAGEPTFGAGGNATASGRAALRASTRFRSIAARTGASTWPDRRRRRTVPAGVAPSSMTPASSPCRPHTAPQTWSNSAPPTAVTSSPRAW